MNFFKLSVPLITIGLYSTSSLSAIKKDKDDNLASKSQTLSSLDSSKIDSMKWLMYSINYGKQASHFRNINKPTLGVVECDISFTEDYSRKDTVLYLFTFYDEEERNIYVPNNSYMHGIGFSNKSY
jgi:hypothetical protein